MPNIIGKTDDWNEMLKMLNCTSGVCYRGESENGNMLFSFGFDSDECVEFTLK